MKTTHNTILLLMTLAVAPGAFAQSNRVPGPQDYDNFSRFITDRNIFDPNRVPHYSGNHPFIKHPRPPASAPFLSLVGIMSYSKGMFAFFNGNDDDLRQVLSVSGKIAGYTVTEVTTTQVKLVSDDKKETLDLKVGDVLRQMDGKWEMSDSRDLPEQTSSPASTGGSNSESQSSATDNSAAPSPALGANDILKRLMELRAKENQ